MSSTQMQLEVVVVPVTDVDRAKSFYEGLGWRLDNDAGPIRLATRRGDAGQFLR